MLRRIFFYGKNKQIQKIKQSQEIRKLNDKLNELKDKINEQKDELNELKDKINEQKDELNEQKDKINELKDKINEQNTIMRILYVGELASTVKIFIRLQYVNKNMYNRNMSLIDYDQMIHEGNEYLDEIDINKWIEFKKKLQCGDIQIKELSDALKEVSKWRNKVAHPKDWPISLPVRNENKIN